MTGLRPRNDRQAAQCPAGVPQIATATGLDWHGLPIMVSRVLPVVPPGGGEPSHRVDWNGVVYVSEEYLRDALASRSGL